MSWNKGNNCNNMHGATIKKKTVTIKLTDVLSTLHMRAHVVSLSR